VQLLEGITKKLTAPAISNASPDAPQNQIESKPALEAEALASEASEDRNEQQSYRLGNLAPDSAR
jgi:hypothetical protein